MRPAIEETIFFFGDATTTKYHGWQHEKVPTCFPSRKTKWRERERERAQKEPSEYGSSLLFTFQERAKMGPAVGWENRLRNQFCWAPFPPFLFYIDDVDIQQDLDLLHEVRVVSLLFFLLSNRHPAFSLLILPALLDTTS